MSSYPCIPNYTYFDSPDFLKLSLHIITIISTPIYLLGLYCILFKTPDVMKSVKWYLFILHASITLFDYSFSVLTIPYLMIPQVAGIPFGVLRYLGVPTSFQTAFVLMIQTSVVISSISIYENRYFIICEFRGKQQWRVLRRFWLFFHYVYCMTLLLVVFSILPDQEPAKERLFQSLPCLPEFLYNEPVFVLLESNIFPAIALAFLLIVVAVELAIFISQLLINIQLQQRTARISQKTYQAQKQFLFALFAQSSTLVLTMIFPVSYGIWAFFVNYYNQAVIHVVVISVTTHGLIATVVMLWVHKPYRLAVKEMFGAMDKKLQQRFKVTPMFVSQHY